MSGELLELVEESLDLNLLNNAVRLKFQNCSVLPGGVHVSETHNHVIILIITNQTVHRILLPHPSRMYRSVSWLSISVFIFEWVWQAQISAAAMCVGIQGHLTLLLTVFRYNLDEQLFYCLDA